MTEELDEGRADLESHHIEGFAREGNTPFPVSLYSHIKGNLWTGGCPVGEAPSRFLHIVCLYPWERYKVGEQQIHTVAYLYDDSSGIPDESQLLLLARHVNECCRRGPTLVHCQAGLNRSALVAGLALIEGGMPPDEAIALLRNKRSPAVLCNRTFAKWLTDRPVKTKRVVSAETRARMSASQRARHAKRRVA